MDGVSARAQVLNDLQRDNHALRSRVAHLEAFGDPAARGTASGSVRGASARPPRPSAASFAKLLGGQARPRSSPSNPTVGDGGMAPAIGAAGSDEAWSPSPGCAVEDAPPRCTPRGSVRFVGQHGMPVRPCFAAMRLVAALQV